MQKLKKLTAFCLAAAMLAMFTGCGDMTWSYKTNDISLTAGTYIFNLMNSYYEAYGLVSTPDEVDDILNEMVKEDTDGAVEKTVEQFALQGADEATMRMIAVEALFKKYDLKFATDDNAMLDTYGKSAWSSMKQTCEEFGISEESFMYCYAEASTKSNQVFKAVYGKDGEKYVSDKELIEYYKSKYSGYAYFSLSANQYDDEGNATPRSDEEMKQAEKDFKSYVEMINKKDKSYKDTVKQYMEDYSEAQDPTMSGSYSEDDKYLDKDVLAALKKLKEGEAKLVKTGEGDTTIYYMVYKPATDDIIDFLDAEDDDAAETADTPTEETDDDGIRALKTGYSHESLLSDMKSDEYKDFLIEYANSLGVQKNNNVLKTFTPKLFVQDKDSDSD